MVLSLYALSQAMLSQICVGNASFTLTLDTTTKRRFLGLAPRLGYYSLLPLLLLGRFLLVQGPVMTGL